MEVIVERREDNNTQSDKKAVTDKKNKQEKANTDVKK